MRFVDQARDTVSFLSGLSAADTRGAATRCCVAAAEALCAAVQMLLR